MAATAVTVSQRQGYTSTVRTGAHTFSSDQPVEAGGADEGPSPWQLVLAGMGSCTAITIEMYARQRQWQVEGIEVHLERTEVGVIEMSVTVRGDLDEGQRARLESVSARCPVVKALGAGVEVQKTLSVHGPRSGA